MNKFLFVSTTAITTILCCNFVQADTDHDTKVKEAATFTTAVVGGLAAGPVGLVLGAFTGAYFADRKLVTNTKAQLQQNMQNITDLEQDLTERELQITQLKKASSNKLEFQVMFPTGASRLTSQDAKRIKSLATYLKDNAELNVRLNGYADPRGEEEYNYALAKERAQSVVAALEERGIDGDRISYNSHGASQSVAMQGDLEAYAMERRVNIEVFAPEAYVEITDMEVTETEITNTYSPADTI